MHESRSSWRHSPRVPLPRRWLAGVMLAAVLPAHAATITCPPAMVETPVVSSLLKGWEIDVRAGRRSLAGAAIHVSRGSEHHGVAPDVTGSSGRQEVAAWTIAPSEGEIYWVACSYGNTSALLLQRVPETAHRCFATYDAGSAGRHLGAQSVECQ
jgi:hypothetical protein